MYADDYFNKHTWIWGGKPHWAYNTKYLILEKDRTPFEWTPNTIFSKVKITGQKATIVLQSDTPNLKEYQIKKTRTVTWQTTVDSLEIPLKKGKYEFLFRTINLADVEGPEHRVVIMEK